VISNQIEFLQREFNISEAEYQSLILTIPCTRSNLSPLPTLDTIVLKDIDIEPTADYINSAGTNDFQDRSGFVLKKLLQTLSEANCFWNIVLGDGERPQEQGYYYSGPDLTNEFIYYSKDNQYHRITAPIPSEFLIALIEGHLNVSKIQDHALVYEDITQAEFMALLLIAAMGYENPGFFERINADSIISWWDNLVEKEEISTIKWGKSFWPAPFEIDTNNLQDSVATLNEKGLLEEIKEAIYTPRKDLKVFLTSISKIKRTVLIDIWRSVSDPKILRFPMVLFTDGECLWMIDYGELFDDPPRVLLQSRTYFHLLDIFNRFMDITFGLGQEEQGDSSHKLFSRFNPTISSGVIPTLHKSYFQTARRAQRSPKRTVYDLRQLILNHLKDKPDQSKQKVLQEQGQYALSLFWNDLMPESKNMDWFYINLSNIVFNPLYVPEEEELQVTWRAFINMFNLSHELNLIG